MSSNFERIYFSLPAVLRGESSDDGGVVLSGCLHCSCRGCLMKWIEREEASGQTAVAPLDLKYDMSSERTDNEDAATEFPNHARCSRPVHDRHLVIHSFFIAEHVLSYIPFSAISHV